MDFAYRSQKLFDNVRLLVGPKYCLHYELSAKLSLNNLNTDRYTLMLKPPLQKGWVEPLCAALGLTPDFEQWIKTHNPDNIIEVMYGMDNLKNKLYITLDDIYALESNGETRIYKYHKYENEEFMWKYLNNIYSNAKQIKDVFVNAPFTTSLCTQYKNNYPVAHTVHLQDGVRASLFVDAFLKCCNIYCCTQECTDQMKAWITSYATDNYWLAAIGLTNNSITFYIRNRANFACFLSKEV